MELKSLIALKTGVFCGPGKLSAWHDGGGGGGDSGKCSLAIVQEASVRILVLDKDGQVLQADLVEFHDWTNVRQNQLQVAWWAATQLIAACNDQIALVTHDADSHGWNVVATRSVAGPDDDDGGGGGIGVSGGGQVACLASDVDSIYIGTDRGVWQSGADLECRRRLVSDGASAVRASASWLAVGGQRGRVHLLKRRDGRWVEHAAAADGPPACCTDLLIDQDRLQVVTAAFSTGHLRLFSLATAQLLVEVAAHLRWIGQLIDAGRGRFASAAEDGFVHLWRRAGETIEYADSIQLENGLLVGGVRLGAEHDDRAAFVLAVYGRPELYVVTT